MKTHLVLLSLLLAMPALADVVPLAVEPSSVMLTMPAHGALAVAVDPDLAAPDIAVLDLPLLDEAAGVEAIAKLVFVAVTSGQWVALAALGVVLLVWAARRYGGRWWPWLLTPRGGASLVLLWSVACALANAFLAKQSFSLELLLTALTTGAVAVGFRKLALSFMADPVPAAEAAGAKAAAAVPMRDPLDIANGR